jgi:hypothetical protein
MKLHGDISGQLMLTGAFILAVLLVSIALILNNVVYFNNVSYMGFMDHSSNSDASIKNLVAQAAISAYDDAHGNANAFNRIMQDTANSLNNVTLQKGIKVVISPPEFFRESYDPSSTYPSTKFDLTINTKGSNKTYTIATTYYPPPPPPPNTQPLHCTVKMISNKTQMNVTGIPDIALITIMVLDNESHPLGGVPVNLDSMLGTFYDENYELAYPRTDDSGFAHVYYIPTRKGMDILNASVGSNPSRDEHNLSDNVSIINYGKCMHSVNIGAETDQSDNDGKNKYWVDITVPITITDPASNFSSFSVGAIFNGGNGEAEFLSPSLMGNFSATGNVGNGYSKDMVVRLGWKHHNREFRADITVIVDAFCNVDYAPYSNTRTFTVTRSANT